MKLLVLHLSDMHVTDESNVILSRTRSIVDAIKNMEYGLDACVVALTGDVTYSATEDQFVLAMGMINDLTELLPGQLSGNGHESVPVHVAVVPGNHDCDFSEDQSIRDLVLEKITRDPGSVPECPIINACTSVHANFFNFQRSLGGPAVAADECESRLC